MADSAKILVVDDEAILVKSVERVLGSHGYVVSGALHSREAIAKLEKELFDLVFVDIKMPEIDGIKLVTWIRHFYPATGVVIITGYPSQETMTQAIELGVIDYVPKPFTPAGLLEITGRALQAIREKENTDKHKKEFSSAKIEEVDRLIMLYKNKPGSIIPVLQAAQGIVGYLPPSMLKRISRGMNIPEAEVHGVVSFYSYFTMKPRGKHIIRVCLGTACYVKGAQNIIDRLKDVLKIDVGQMTEDRNFSLEAVRCLGACGLAPVMVVGQETYGAVTPKKAVEIIGQYDPKISAESSTEEVEVL